MKLVIASNNKGKINEFKQLLEPLGYDVLSQGEAGVDIEVEETGTTFAGNSALKARAIFQMMNCAVLADDSGLEVDALGGEPGVYSARYGGVDSDSERCQLILEKMVDVPDEKRGASFVCAVHFIKGNGDEICVQGKCEGTIGYAPIGENGFGYDPIFMFEGKSFAQHSQELKNKISHRGNALTALMDRLK